MRDDDIQACIDFAKQSGLACAEDAEQKYKTVYASLLDIAGPKGISLNVQKYSGRDAVSMRRVARAALDNLRSRHE